MPGQGRTPVRHVALIHGAATTSRVWRHVVPLLAAAGPLLPGLLDQVRSAYAAGGVPAFGRTLYGPVAAGRHAGPYR